MKKTPNRIPQFKNEDEEREFWVTHSPLDYFKSSSFKRASFPNLKPSLKSISIRLPADMLAELKTLGAHNVNRKRPHGLTGRRVLQGMMDAYEASRVEGLLPATYDVLFGVLEKQ